jgi:hypothetical protein
LASLFPAAIVLSSLCEWITKWSHSLVEAIQVFKS